METKLAVAPNWSALGAGSCFSGLGPPAAMASALLGGPGVSPFAFSVLS